LFIVVFKAVVSYKRLCSTGGMPLTGENWGSRTKTYYIDYYKSHMDCPGNEPGFPWL